jgi:phospholipase/carboxylesterase
MPLECIEVQSPAVAGADSPVSASIIVLHGLGADGHDFEPIAQQLQLGTVGTVRFILPHAPQRPVTLNGGMVMRAWYDITGSELTRREDETGLRQSQALIDALIDREVERGVKASRIVLMGFSQGCAMTLMTGLRHPRRLAGLVGLSGYLPLADRTAAEASAANASVPIFMAHGHADPMIPIARATASRDALRALRYAVQWHEYPMPHAVCANEISDLNHWLLRVLA